MSERDMRQWTSPEEQARDEIGHTMVRPAVARVFAAACLALVAVVPLTRLADGAPFVDFARALPAAARVFAADGFFAGNRALLARIDDFETELERTSAVLETMLPYAQWLLTRWGGVGNERAIVGRDGWLLYRPGLEYLTGRPFLEPEVLERRRASGPSWRAPPEPDPRPAILDFARQLAERGVDLVVMPTPTKAMVHPEALAGDADLLATLHNPSFAALRAELEAAGVEVFDPAPLLLAARRDDPRAELFLRTDSHWRPEAVDAVARALAARLRPRLPAPGEASPWRQEPATHVALGDLGRMLELPPGQELYPEETVELVRVLDAAGDPWRPAPDAPVLLLGDSFTNVFSRPDLGWGKAAGLAERLAWHLGTGVDRIAINDGAAGSVRRRLAQALAAGDDRLAGKKVVIYQLAVRELTTGDWPVLPLPETGAAVPGPRPEAPSPTGDVPADDGPSAGQPAVDRPVVDPPADDEPSAGQPAVDRPVVDPPADDGPIADTPDDDAGVVVRGTIAALATLPAPGSTPYRDAILALRLNEIEPADVEPPAGTAVAGGFAGEILVYLWGLRNGERTPASRYRVGQRLELRLVPWAAVAAELETYQRLELPGDDWLFLDAYWAEEHDAVDR